MSETYRIKVDKDRIIGKINRQVYGYLVEHVGRCVYGGIYEEGSPLSDESGFRKDVLEALKRARCPVLRWPGGNFTSFYHWEDGVGPKESRPTKYDLAWRVDESNRFGTDEFVQYCRAVGAEPYICVNVSRQSTPEEAAHWVEYCNRKGNSYYAKLRERNGYPEPHGVKYWGIGNEVYWARGKGNFTPSEYASLLEEYVTLMKSVDPTIKIVAVGLGPEPEEVKKGPPQSKRMENLLKQSLDWSSEVLRKSGDLIDYISFHKYYGTEDYYGTVAAPADAEPMLTRLQELINMTTTGSGREEPVKIAFDEWGFGWPMLTTGWPLYETNYSLKEGLYAAGMLNVFHRQCNAVTMAIFSQLANVLGAIVTAENELRLTPIYLAIDLYANHSGDTALDTLVQSETFDTEYLDLKNVPYIDATATVDEDGGKLYLATVNRHRDQDAECRIALDGFTPKREARVFELNGPYPMARIEIGHADIVNVQEKTITGIGSDFRYVFPAHSATVIEMDVSALAPDG